MRDVALEAVFRIEKCNAPGENCFFVAEEIATKIRRVNGKDVRTIAAQWAYEDNSVKDFMDDYCKLKEKIRPDMHPNGRRINARFNVFLHKSSFFNQMVKIHLRNPEESYLDFLENDLEKLLNNEERFYKEMTKSKWI